MYQCPKCKGWIAPHDDTYSHACSGTLAKMRDKVAEHKALQADPDYQLYQLAKAAYTVLRVLCPPSCSPTWHRAWSAIHRVAKAERGISIRAEIDTMHLTPRRRWQDKKENAGD